MLGWWWGAGKPIDDMRLGVEASVFLVAGFETSGHTLSFALFELAANPEWQQRAYEELLQLGLAGPGMLCYVFFLARHLYYTSN